MDLYRLDSSAQKVENWDADFDLDLSSLRVFSRQSSDSRSDEVRAKMPAEFREPSKASNEIKRFNRERKRELKRGVVNLPDPRLRRNRSSRADILEAFREDEEEDENEQEEEEGFGSGEVDDSINHLTSRLSRANLGDPHSYMFNLQDLKEFEETDSLNEGDKVAESTVAQTARRLQKKASMQLIKSALSAGIPVPRDIPMSALVGGTIKRLGRLENNRGDSSTIAGPIMPEDWSEEFELEQRKSTNSKSPLTLRAKPHDIEEISFEDFENHDNSIIRGTFFDPPTKELRQDENDQPYSSSHGKSRVISSHAKDDDFEAGFEFPLEAPMDPVKLARFRTSAAPPAMSVSDDAFSDRMWGDQSDSGRLGAGLRGVGGRAISQAGSRRDSLTSSVFSSGVASTTTTFLEQDSEDAEDMFEGVQFPDAPIDFNTILLKRQQQALELAIREHEMLQAKANANKGKSTYRKDRNAMESQIYPDFNAQQQAPLDDFFEGFEQEGLEGGHFKDTIHRNVVFKSKGSSNNKYQNYAKKPLVSVTFTTQDSTGRSNNKLSNPSSPRKLSSKQSMPAIKSSYYSGSPQYTLDSPLHTSSPLNNPANNPYETIRPKNSMPVLRQGASQAPSTPSQVNQENFRTRTSGQLRPAQSMQNLVSVIRPDSQIHTSKKDYGDGTELDLFDELSTNMKAEKTVTASFRTLNGKYNSKSKGTFTHKPLEKPVKPTTLRNPTKASLLKEKSKSRVHTSRKRNAKGSGGTIHGKPKGPGLIQQLGPPVAAAVKGNNGTMHFDPEKLVWEGNDVDLTKFDSINPKAPGLIAHISGKGKQVVGNMMFDPKQMRWVNLKQEEADVFEGLEDLDASLRGSRDSRQALQGGTVSSRAAVMSRNASENNLRSFIGEFTIGNEFNIGPELLKKLQHEDERWPRKVRGWFGPNESFDRDYMNDIRNMVMRDS